MTRGKRFQKQPGQVSLRLTAGDKEILKALARHHLMTAPQISQATDRSYQVVLRRLHKLFHHGYVDRLKVPITENTPIPYIISRKGLNILGQKRRFHVPSRQIKHALFVTEITLKLLKAFPPESASCGGSERTDRDWDNLFRVEAKLWWKGTRYRFHIIPDHVILWASGKAKKLILIEADCGTMPVRRSDLDQSSILKKVLAYRKALMTGRLYRDSGLRHVHVVIVTFTPARRDNILFMLKEERLENSRIQLISIGQLPEFGASMGLSTEQPRPTP